MSGKVLYKGMDGPVGVCMNLTGCCAVPETIITVHELSDSTNCTYCLAIIVWCTLTPAEYGSD